jgi:capsular polysaccharide export protein
MAPHPDKPPFTAGEHPRRLFFYNAGFLRQPRLRRILALAGHDLRLGLPDPNDGVVVWGRSPYARRGEAVARRRGVPLVRLEDAFLRSLRPGRMGEPPLGLIIDPLGVHFDAASPSRTEAILAGHPLDDSNLLLRAKTAMARIRALDLSKYNIHDPDLPLPSPGYVLVVDQTRGDASIRHGCATAATFSNMLLTALDQHPGTRLVIKTHPETALGLRAGHFSKAD